MVAERLRRVDVEGEERLATLNLASGVRVYDERLVLLDGDEYRVWDPFRSKLAVAMIKGLKDLPIHEGCRVLYLGVSTGTTASHVSDLIGKEGVIFGVEVAARVAREFMERVVKHRGNVVPIVEDARRPERYYSIYGKVDVVYCDVAQPDQTDIAVKNCRLYLRKGGRLLLIVKARSIDSTKQPKEVFREEVEKLQQTGFTVKQIVDLEPFDKDHVLIDAVWLKDQKQM